MKPHKETWTLELILPATSCARIVNSQGIAVLVPADNTVQTIDGRIIEVLSPEARSRARLAAQAPAMARVLIECRESLVYFDQTTRSNDLGDALTRVLRDAGVIP